MIKHNYKVYPLELMLSEPDLHLQNKFFSVSTLENWNKEVALRSLAQPSTNKTSPIHQALKPASTISACSQTMTSEIRTNIQAYKHNTWLQPIDFHTIQKWSDPNTNHWDLHSYQNTKKAIKAGSKRTKYHRSCMKPGMFAFFRYVWMDLIH